MGKSSVAGGATFDDRREAPFLCISIPNRMWSQKMKYHYHRPMVINILSLLLQFTGLPHCDSPTSPPTNASQHHNCFILVPKMMFSQNYDVD